MEYLAFKPGSNFLCVSPSMSGKTHFCKTILSLELFDPPYKRLCIFSPDHSSFKDWTPPCDDVQLLRLEDLFDFQFTELDAVLIDDVQIEVKSSDKYLALLQKLCNMECNHKRLYVFICLQYLLTSKFYPLLTMTKGLMLSPLAASNYRLFNFIKDRICDSKEQAQYFTYILTHFLPKCGFRENKQVPIFLILHINSHVGGEPYFKGLAFLDSLPEFAVAFYPTRVAKLKLTQMTNVHKVSAIGSPQLALREAVEQSDSVVNEHAYAPCCN